MIEVRNLVKKYGSHLAVDHLDFTIEDGRIYGFLGPNGAGKSTTMNIMTGYLGATEGEVLINGHDILKEPEEAKKHIGYLPEMPPLYTDMTVREYLEFAAELKKIPKKKREDSVTEVEKLVKIKDVENRLIKICQKDTARESVWRRRYWGSRRSSYWMSLRWDWIRSRSSRSGN